VVARLASTTKPAPRLTRSFPAAGVTRLILRASAAQAARVTTLAATSIDVSGVPTGGAPGYHPSDPSWREKSPQEWGFDFVSVRRGHDLIVSTKNEIEYIHHGYTLEDLTVAVPPGIEVVREPRTLTGSGAPDLR
jgi:hypothetical protein